MKHFHFTLEGLRRLRKDGLPARDWLAAWPAACIASATLALQARSTAAATDATEQPIFVLGHWRSGTTWLHELLSLDPAFSTPNAYECLYPHHFALTESSLGRASKLRRTQPRPMDGMPVSLDSPQEDEFALMSLGAISMYRWMVLPARFEDCLRDLDAKNWSAANTAQWVALFRDFLARVQALRPGRLLLKSPTHQFRVPLLRELFPRARFVHLVRDPRSVYASSIKLWREMFALHARQPYAGLDIGECVMRIGELQERVALPDIAALPPATCHRVRYEDLVAAPTETVRELRHALGLAWQPEDAARLNDYLRQRQGHRAASDRQRMAPELEATLRRRWPVAFNLFGAARH
jgi:hypothetical protein